MMEISLMRDFYVKNLTSSKNQKNKVNEYFSQKVYEFEFLIQFYQRLNIKKPPLIMYLKSVLLYEKEITQKQFHEKLSDKMLLFVGFEKNASMPITEELI